jgi:replicative DNA helicase
MVVIDYLGLIRPATKGGSTYENVSQVSRDLKRMALSLNVPVMCLSQLSRTVEGREDKRPRLSDLRDSGAIEQDADAVLFLYRDDYYQGVRTAESAVQLNVAKNRHGSCGTTNFTFFRAISAFKEVS